MHQPERSVVDQGQKLSRSLIGQVVPQNFERLIRHAYQDPKHIWRHFKRLALGKRLIVVVATAHKVGSTWLYSMLKSLGDFEVGSNFISSEFLQSGTILLEPEVFDYLRRLHRYVIFKSHSYPVSPELANNIKFVSIYRDPRDVIVSSIFYLAYLDEDKGGWGEKFRRLSETERITTFIKEGEFNLSRLEQWFRTPTAYKIRYEDLKKQPVRELEGILNYLGLVTDKKRIERVVSEHSFTSRTGRRPGEERKESALRKGIVGDWKNYFDQDCIVAFKTEQRGRWNSLLVEMSYEKMLNWE
jgi:hypothetical protein